MRVTSGTSVSRVVLTAALLIASSPPTIAQVRRLGAYIPSTTVEAVRHTDAEDPVSVLLLDENYRFATGAANADYTWSRVYVIDGQFVREFRRHDLITGPIRSYNAGSLLLDVKVAGNEGELFLLGRTALQLVDLNATPAPRILSSVPVSNAQTTWGSLLATFGDTVYVADNSLRGFKVVDFSIPSSPAVLAQYTSKAKVTGNPSRFAVTDLHRNGTLLSLIVGNNLDLISVDSQRAPTVVTSLGVAKFAGSTRGVLGGGYAFLADGLSVHVVRATPGVAGFLTEVLRFDSSAAITDLFVREGRLYLLCGKQGYEIWDVSAYAPS
jgi:hypothetical protein